MKIRYLLLSTTIYCSCSSGNSINIEEPQPLQPGENIENIEESPDTAVDHVSMMPKSYKRGIAYDFPNYQDLNVVSPGVSWYYNWGVTPNEHVTDNFEKTGVAYVPMTWGKDFDMQRLKEFLQKHPSVKYLLGFNEPNFFSQSGLTPTQAAALWPQLETAAKEFGLKLISPACNWSGDNMVENGVSMRDPVNYLDAFFNAYPQAQVDYIGIHFYMDAKGLAQNLERVKKYNRKIWLTEFNLDNMAGNAETMDQQRDFMVSALDSLEKDTMIYHYSWFIGRSPIHAINILADGSGELSVLGKIYTNMSSYDNTFYHKTDIIIPASQYVNMKGISLIDCTDKQSGKVVVGYTDNGDWMDYQIDVPQNEKYTLEIRTSGLSDGELNILDHDANLAKVDLPSTGSWDTWHTIKAELTLSRGHHRIRLNVVKSGFNINWIRFCSSK